VKTQSYRNVTDKRTDSITIASTRDSKFD